MPQDPIDNTWAQSAAIPNATVAVAAPTKAEFDALVGTVNAALAALRESEIIAGS